MDRTGLRVALALQGARARGDTLDHRDHPDKW